MRLNSLSGRFFLVTLFFVIIAELLIVVPSLAAFRIDYLQQKLEKGQLASLALLASEAPIESALEAELLRNAAVYNVVLRRDEMRQLVLSSALPGPVARSYDLRDVSPLNAATDAVRQMFDGTSKVIRVIGAPVNEAGELIEITLDSAPLTHAMRDYGLRVLAVSAVLVALTALLLNLAAQRLVLRPIRRVIAHMTAYAQSPQDHGAVITPDARITELRDAETALAGLQTSLTSALRQRERLAGLGQAVAKISHDLRNILATAQIFADRLEDSADPKVRRAAPKLVNSITRAINLCETTLAFGKAEEPPPVLSRFLLADLTRDVIEAESLAAGPELALNGNIPRSLMLRADREQLYRVLSNLVRNARQAIEGTGKPGQITLSAGEDDQAWWIEVSDTGPGLPQKARDFLFQPFTGGTRKGGTGLGLAIAADLVRGHGGALELRDSSAAGSTFRIALPKLSVAENLLSV